MHSALLIFKKFCYHFSFFSGLTVLLVAGSVVNADESVARKYPARVLLENINVYKIPVDAESVTEELKPGDLVIPSGREIVASEYRSDGYNRFNKTLSIEIHNLFEILHSAGVGFYDTNRSFFSSLCSFTYSNAESGLSGSTRLCLANFFRDRFDLEFAREIFNRRSEFYEHLVEGNSPNPEIKANLLTIATELEKFGAFYGLTEKELEQGSEDVFIAIMVAAYDLYRSSQGVEKRVDYWGKSLRYPNGAEIDSPLFRDMISGVIHFDLDITQISVGQLERASRAYLYWSKTGIPSLNGLYLTSNHGPEKRSFAGLKEELAKISIAFSKAAINFKFYLALQESSQKFKNGVLRRRGSQKKMHAKLGFFCQTVSIQYQITMKSLKVQSRTGWRKFSKK